MRATLQRSLLGADSTDDATAGWLGETLLFQSLLLSPQPRFAPDGGSALPPQSSIPFH